MRTHLTAGIVLLTVLSVGCGGKMSASPTSPSAVSTSAPAAGGATLNGIVRVGATAGIGTASDPLTVQVVGTNLTTGVTSAGQFTLGDVPSGSVQLHFSGAGTNAYATLASPVTAGETVTVTVTVSGTSAVVESEEHDSGNGAEEQIEGLIESLPPAQPAGTLVVAGRTITTDASTVIKQGSVTKTFADLAIGQRVHVQGHTSGSTFLATQIEIQNDSTTQPVNVNGIVSDLTGTAASFQFMADGRQVTGDSQTTFFSSDSSTDSTGSTPLTFADLKDGERVEVKGQQRDSAVYAVTIYINVGGTGGGDNEFEATGPISGLTGTCPALTFTLDSKTVKTDATTTFENSGGCSAITAGMTLDVQGTVQTDGTVLASKVDAEGDQGDNGQAFDGEGTVAGLTGTCPAISFTLGTTPIDANAATKFDGGSCSALQNGDRVEVKGNWEPGGGRVLATKIEQ